MAFHNVNFAALPLPVGSYDASGGTLGNNVTASTVHEVFCLTAGTVKITAMGGGTFTWAATAGQSVKVMCGRIEVSSGSFVGFLIQGNPFVSRNSSGL